MKRKIVKIDAEKCNGCGLCVNACHEGALQLIDGKAVLVKEDYCDGLGACLPECPAGAIMLEEREAAPFDAAAVAKHLAAKVAPVPPKLACGCPGTETRLIERRPCTTAPANAITVASQLRQWPCQLQLVPVNAAFLAGADLLVAADCTAFAYANIHADFMQGKVTLVGCPKLDDADYRAKLTAILQHHPIKSITVLRMEVPCCGGLATAVTQALAASGKNVPCRVVTIGTGGDIRADETIS
ncbi:MAG: 4Fe-4S binding protein [Heliobacteriaceae bacterium]|nr:4Fe-4S binding protein [Heliobacteriaceae bacterium]